MQIPDKYIFGLTSTEYRPCFVTEVNRGRNPRELAVSQQKALFHKWTLEQEVAAPGLVRGSHPGGQLSKTLGIVELENGIVRMVEPSSIRFIDTDGIMRQLCYDEGEET